MNIEITCRHMDHTRAIDNLIKQKIKHFDKYFNFPIDIKWICTVDNKEQRSEVHLHAKHEHFHATGTSNDLYKTFDLVVDKIESQIRKNHGKKQTNQNIDKSFLNNNLNANLLTD